ncbi:MAG: hypothetical protein J2P47_05705 [Acetobacteraceae bacterium]|nr:hypothetical protein [Acetobacteraceae bacterium]
MDEAFDLRTAHRVAPFPRAKFLKFISRLKIQSKDYGLVPFRLLGSQRYMLDEICVALDKGITDILILKNRQCGCTTFCIALDMFWAFEHKGLLGTFILHKEEARDDWRTTIEIFYEEIPRKTMIDGRLVRFKPEIMNHNRNILSFKNGSRFRYLIAGTQENKRGGLGRSGASNFVHMTEAAYYGNDEDVAAFESSTSSIYPHRLNLQETTANGFNWWEEQWTDALRSKTKHCIFVGWWRDERNAFPTDHPFYRYFMPDESITKLERERVRAVKAEYGYDISLQQIAWYRWHLAEKKRNDQSLMDQECPWTADDAYQATGARYFHSADLTAAIREARRHLVAPYRYRIGNRWDSIEVVNHPSRDAELKIWQQASKFGYYVVSCDPAYGSSETADKNIIQVWRCFADAIEQVAEFASSSLSMYQCAWVLAHLGGFYGTNESRVILEMNGPGKAVFMELQQVKRDLMTMPPTADNHELRNCLNRMHHFFYQRADSLGSSEFVYQWIMTEQLKSMIMARFKDGFELGRLKVRSVAMLEEMRRTINDAGHITAEGNAKDDRVIAGALAYECYNRWMRQKLIGMHMTRAHSEVVEKNGGESQMHRIVTGFLRKANIAVKERAPALRR